MLQQYHFSNFLEGGNTFYFYFTTVTQFPVHIKFKKILQIDSFDIYLTWSWVKGQIHDD